MKFAKRLEDEVMPEWQTEYVSYKKLKKLIKRIHTEEEDLEKSNKEKCKEDDRKENGQAFVNALLNELRKVENFFKIQLDGAMHQKSQLRQSLAELEHVQPVVTSNNFLTFGRLTVTNSSPDSKGIFTIVSFRPSKYLHLN